MRILLTNDDGFDAPGIVALRKSLGTCHELLVAAPEAERSAAGHAITLADPLRVDERRAGRRLIGWAISGTPADCVKIAVGSLLAAPPDLVVSGVNRGANVGVNVLYSGTVSAATEAAILGFPAMAVSVGGAPGNFMPAASIARRLIERIPFGTLPPGVLLNVNIPDLPRSRIRGIRVTRMGGCRMTEWFDRRVDPGGRAYYWLSAQSTADDGGLNEEIDDGALRAGFVSVTPLHPDLTAHALLAEARRWNLVLG